MMKNLPKDEKLVKKYLKFFCIVFCNFYVSLIVWCELLLVVYEIYVASVGKPSGASKLSRHSKSQPRHDMSP